MTPDSLPPSPGRNPDSETNVPFFEQLLQTNMPALLPPWLRLPPMTWLPALLMASASAPAAGVAVIKEQAYHRDSAARPIAYQRVIDSQGPWLRLVTSTGDVDIRRATLADRIEVPDAIPPSITTEDDLAPLRKDLKELRAFTERYPLSAPLLNAPIAALQSHIARFEAGEIRFEGNWISREEHNAQAAEREAAEKERRRLEIEQTAFEAAQRDKGLVKRDGRWIPAHEAATGPPTARTELSDTLVPLINADLDGARLALGNLTRLMDAQTGAPKVRTERLHTVLRNLFLAEHRLSQGQVAAAASRAQAAEHDRRAAEWLKPNAFGTQRKEAARESRAKAARIRETSAKEIETLRSELLEALHQADLLAADFHKFNEHRVALSLGETLRRVAERNFKKDAFQPTFPDSTLDQIRQAIANNPAAPDPAVAAPPTE